jgi:hypothetical protein
MCIAVSQSMRKISLILILTGLISAHADDLAPLCELRVTNLKLMPDGRIQFGADGFPDRSSFVAAQAANEFLRFENRWVGMNIPPPDMALLKRFQLAYQTTMEFIYSGANRALLENEFESKGGYKDGRPLSWDEIAVFIRFKNGFWWMREDANDPRHKPNYNEELQPEIKFATTRSTVLKEAGPGATSRIYWSRLKSSGGVLIPDMMGPHVRVISGPDQKEKSIEMFAAKVTTTTRGWFKKTTTTQVDWHAFLFEQIGDVWIPRVAELDTRKSTNCIACHGTIGATGRLELSPRPKELKTADDFRAVGYSDERIIEEFIKTFPR